MKLEIFMVRGSATAGLAFLMVAAFASPAAAEVKASPPAERSVAAAPEPVDGTIPHSAAVSQLAYWVIATRDNNDLPFIIVDKNATGVWVFDAKGLFMGAAPALVGITAGDDAQAGVGDRELSDIPPAQRTTPAGRFVASFGRAAGGRNVLWVDYPTAISLHAVVTHNRKEKRLQRLKSPTSEDNRITYGCINVPTEFYKNTVRTLFSTAHGIVYILPDTKSLTDVFPAYRPLQPAYQSALSR